MKNNVTIIRGKVKGVFSEFDIKQTPESDGDVRITGWASKPVVDRFQEVVDIEAFASTMLSFMQNPVMLSHHRLEDTIGMWDEFSITPEGLKVGGFVSSGFEPADTVQLKIQKRLLRGLSIGFRELDGYLDEETDIYHITKLELIEISVVSVPANQDALFIMENGKCAGITLVPEGTDAKILEEEIMKKYGVQDASDTQSVKIQTGTTEGTLVEVVAGLTELSRQLTEKVTTLEATYDENFKTIEGVLEMSGATTAQTIEALNERIKELQTQLDGYVADADDRLDDTELCVLNLLEIQSAQLSDTSADNREV